MAEQKEAPKTINKLGGGAVGVYVPLTKKQCQEIADLLKVEVEAKAKESGVKIKVYEAVSGEYQIVAGTNYRITLKYADNEYAQIQAFQTLPLGGQPSKLILKSVTFGNNHPLRPKLILGGYQPASKKSLQEIADAIKAEVEAKAKEDGVKIKCYEVLSGEYQMVAGINYRFKLKYNDTNYAQIQAFKSLNGEVSLVSVEFGGFISSPVEEIMTGAYVKVPRSELEGPAKCAKEQFEAEAKLRGVTVNCYEVFNGERQIVAGINYKINIIYNVDPDTQVLKYAKTLIFSPLSGGCVLIHVDFA